MLVKIPKRKLPIIILLLSASILYLAFINVTKEKMYNQFLNFTKMGQDSIVDAEYRMHKFPIPYMIIDKIEQKNKVVLRNIKINLSFLSILTFNPKIDSIRVGEAVIYLAQSNTSIAEHDKLIQEVINKDTLPNN